MSDPTLNTVKALEQLNQVLELELAGVIRYTHYSLMVYGFGRIPIVSWLRSQADESLLHAHEAGELITQLDGTPSLSVGPLLKRVTYDIADILQDSLQHEERALQAYQNLLATVTGSSVMLEEYSTRMVSDETRHAGDVRKMLRAPRN
ncbi:MAG: ferritin-like domain-containing protein [Gammaproteobacteria bacterium]